MIINYTVKANDVCWTDLVHLETNIFTKALPTNQRLDGTMNQRTDKPSYKRRGRI